MKRNDLLACIKSICEPYTAPYNEAAARSAVCDILHTHSLPVTIDAFGNTITRVRHGAPRRKVAFIAHLDHPALRVEKIVDSTVHCVAEGGMPAKGSKGAAIVFQSTDGSLSAGKILSTQVGADKRGRERLQQATVKLSRGQPSPQVGDFGVFDLPGFKRQEHRLQLRAADDLAGAAAVVATLVDLAKSREPIEVWGIFTRAEEVGFHGAMALILDGKLPRDLYLVSVECSKAYGDVALGMGPVVRLGDRAGPFDPHVCALVRGAAEALGPKFKYQAAMMAGGTCEASPFLAFGYNAGGIAMPLANYHNQGSRTVAPEEIDLRDLEGAISLMGAVATRAGAGIDDMDLWRNHFIRDSEAGRERLRMDYGQDSARDGARDRGRANGLPGEKSL